MGRAGELDRLLPLVRFPLMKTVEAVMAEPLFVQHPLMGQLLYECHPGFATSAAAAGCRRLRPRKGKPDLGWMDTTDGFAGFKKLDYFPNVALAVSKTDKMEVEKVYGAPAGWHWGSKAEVAAIVGGGRHRQTPGKYHYYDQGGWGYYTWGGVVRRRFVFSDSLQVGGTLQVGGHEGLISEEWTGAELARDLPNKFFAGIVCVAN